VGYTFTVEGADDLLAMFVDKELAAVAARSPSPGDSPPEAMDDPRSRAQGIDDDRSMPQRAGPAVTVEPIEGEPTEGHAGRGPRPWRSLSQ